MADRVIDLDAGTWKCWGVNQDESSCAEIVGKLGIFVIEYKEKADNLTVALCRKHATQEPLRIRLYEDEVAQ